MRQVKQFKTFQLWVNNTLIQTATSDTIKYELNMSLPNHWDVKFLAESSGEDSDSLELRLVYLKTPETAQVPDGLRMELLSTMMALQHLYCTHLTKKAFSLLATLMIGK